MNVVSAVANLQKELDYYKTSCQEMQAIIKQLAGSPPDGFEYIHPYDMSVMIENAPTKDLIIEGGLVYFPFEKKYKQSPFIPAKTKKFS